MPVAKIWPLYARARLNLRDRVLVEVERNSFIACPNKGAYSGLMPLRWCDTLEEVVRSFIQRECDQLMNIFLIGWW